MTNKKRSIALFNDTGNYPHIGCRAVSDSHDALLSSIGIEVIYRHFVNEFTELWTGDFESSLRSVLKSGLLDELSSVDAVVVNGEGTIHHGHGLHLLAIVKAAQAIGKPTYIVNAVIQDVPIAGLKILAELRDLTVRDLFSYQYLQKMGIEARLVADSILGARFYEGVDDYLTNKILVTDCVVSKTNTKLIEVAEHFGSDAVYFPLEGQNADNWQGTLKKIRGCKLIVTGRHHGLYLALMAKVPFVALSSNTWKIEGTLAALQYGDTHNGKESLPDILGMCKAALEDPSAFERVFSHPFIRNHLSTFSVLAKDLGLTASELCEEVRNGCEINRLYENRWSFYWRNNLECKAANDDQESIADRVLLTCGFGRTLDVGSGAGGLVSSLLRAGVDAYGVDVSETATSHCNRRMPGRFSQGSVLELPFEDASFDIVVSTDSLEHLAPEDVPKALKEIHRVASRFVFLQIATTPDRDGHWHLTVEGRAWWEAKCFEAGFRKHPLYYQINSYESLNRDELKIYILLEKVPSEALKCFDLNSLTEERLLHSDMLRETGRRSDAHCIRYYKAAAYIRPGDRVLDVACGLGYGTYILFSASQAASAVGIDSSDFAINYAKAHYRRSESIEFATGDAQNLDNVPDHSVDFIAAFETIEHVEDPMAYLRELRRVLKPSGRIMVCAPNEWVDETGKDPNPHHLHVYTWERLVAEVGAFFLLEQGIFQTAGGALKCPNGDRSWVEFSVNQPPDVVPEWAILLAMADPVAGKDIPYLETTWSLPDSPEFNVAAFERDYANPWLVKGMVAMGMRMRSTNELTDLQERVLSSSEHESVDYGAALCGRIYAYIRETNLPATVIKGIELEVLRYAAVPEPSPHQLRWQISLLYAAGELARNQGRLVQASKFYSECAARDALRYSPLLGNKTLDSLFWLARFALTRSDPEAARTYLQRSIHETYRLVSRSWMNIVGSLDEPLAFGLAEVAQLFDKAARAAYMLQVIDQFRDKPFLLAQESMGFFERHLDHYKGWGAELHSQLVSRDGQIASLNQAVAERDGQIASLNQAVAERDGQIASLNQAVAERDGQIASLNQAVAERDGQIASLNQAVAERDGQIASLNQAVAERDGQIASLNQAVAERDGQIASLNQAVAERDGQIASLNQAVAERDGQIASLNHMLAYARLNLQLLEQSRSWRITKPLRWATRLGNKATWCLSRFESIRRHIGLAAAIRRSISFVQTRVPSLARNKVRHHEIQGRMHPLPAEQLLKGSHQAKPGKDEATVLMLVNSFHDGGVERVVIDLCLQFRNSGRPCKVLVAKDGGRSATEARSHGIEVIELHRNHSTLEQFLLAISEGIVLTHHCYFGLKQFHDAEVPIVEVIHNAYHWQKGNQEIAKYRHEFISSFVSVSEFVRSFSINELGIDPHRVILINNGLSNVDLIRPPLEILREKRLQTAGEPILLHVANLHPQKNHRLVVNAFAHVKRAYPKARLIIAGAMDGYPELAKALLSDIENLGVSDSIQLAGALDRRKLSKTMAAAHIGLLPSMLEGFSIATLELTFFGLPSVLSATGAADELKTTYGHIEIAEGCALPQCKLSVNAIESLLKDFPDDAVLSLSNAILKILDNYPAYLEKSLLAGTSFSEYAIEHTAAQYEQLLTQLESKKVHDESTS